MATVVITFFLKARFCVCKMDADVKEKRSASIFTLPREKRWSMSSQKVESIVKELMKPISDLRASFDTDLASLLEEYLTEAGLHALDAADGGDGDASGGSGAEGGDGGAAGGVPNFVEVALLLQQSVSIYGRKVDFLYQHVLNVSETLHSSSLEIANTSQDRADEPSGDQEEGQATAPTPSRRKRRASTAPAGGGAGAGAGAGDGSFVHVALEASGGARREAGAARPPPTLPRMYIELGPRTAADGDAPLYNYAGEPIGLLTDFHVAWRLQNGLLVEELDGYEERVPLRPIPLMELQAAIEANAPPSPPPLPLREDSSPPDDTREDDASDTDAIDLDVPVGASTPLPAPRMLLTPHTLHTPHTPPADEAPPPTPPPADMPPPPPPLKRGKKRKLENIEDLNGNCKLRITKELLAALALDGARSFSGAARWERRVTAARSRRLLLARRLLRLRVRQLREPFLGHEYCSQDVSGFLGWSGAEVSASLARQVAATARLGTRLPHDESDDDGFFERSSAGDSDLERADVTPPSPHPSPPPPAPPALPAASPPAHTLTAAEQERLERSRAEAEEWGAWRARVAARARAAGGAPLDVRALARDLLAALPPAPHPAHVAPPAPPAHPAPPAPWHAVLHAAAKDSGDVSRLFLATLFLANSGNVEVLQGAALSLGDFSLRLVSDDPRLYAGAASDPACAPPAAPHTAHTPRTAHTAPARPPFTPRPLFAYPAPATPPAPPAPSGSQT